MEHIVRRVHNELNDDDVYKISELTQNQFRNLFPVSQETVERWCRDGVFPGAFKFKSTDKAEWMITGRDFKYYFKTQYQLFV